MLGKAPTRMVVCARPGSTAKNAKANITGRRLLTLVSSDNHGQHTGFLFFLSRPLPFSSRSGLGNQIRERGVLQNVCGCIAYVEEQLVKRSMRQVAVNQRA